jgi:hypothetical protein
MIDEKEVRLLLKNISQKEIINACDLSTKDMFRICRCLAPEHSVELIKKEKNYASAKCALTKAFPVMMSQMFINCVWWETYGGDSFEGNLDRSETSRRWNTIKKQLSRLYEDMNKAEKQVEKVMDGKGLITQQELERHLEDQKNIHNEQMDKKYREDRKSFVALQKRVADMKHNANYYEDIVDKQKLHISYLEKENTDLIRQLSLNAVPPQ